jgi:hypothetical protein
MVRAATRTERKPNRTIRPEKSSLHGALLWVHGLLSVIKRFPPRCPRVGRTSRHVPPARMAPHGGSHAAKTPLSDPSRPARPGFAARPGPSPLPRRRPAPGCLPQIRPGAGSSPWARPSTAWRTAENSSAPGTWPRKPSWPRKWPSWSWRIRADQRMVQTPCKPSNPGSPHPVHQGQGLQGPQGARGHTCPTPRPPPSPRPGPLLDTPARPD